MSDLNSTSQRQVHLSSFYFPELQSAACHIVSGWLFSGKNATLQVLQMLKKKAPLEKAKVSVFLLGETTVFTSTFSLAAWNIEQRGIGKMLYFSWRLVVLCGFGVYSLWCISIWTPLRHRRQNKTLYFYFWLEFLRNENSFQYMMKHADAHANIQQLFPKACYSARSTDATSMLTVLIQSPPWTS